MRENPAALRARVQERLQRDGRRGKYAYASIGRVPTVLFPRRVENLCDYYVAHREIDDIVDGDADLPEEEQSIEDFLWRKQIFLERGGIPADAIEQILLECFERLEQATGETAVPRLRIASLNIIDGHTHDIDRRETFREHNTYALNSREEIDAQTKHVELDGVMTAFLTLLEDDHELGHRLLPLIKATRENFFFLRDLASDVVSGCMNIDRESVESTSPSDLAWFAAHCAALEKNENGAHLPPWKKTNILYREAPPPIRQWMHSQAESAQEGLTRHRESGISKFFRPLTRVLLHQLFEKPAATYFKKLK